MIRLQGGHSGSSARARLPICGPGVNGIRDEQSRDQIEKHRGRTSLWEWNMDKSSLFVVGPQSQHFDDVLALKHLVDEPVLNVNASRVGSSQIAHQLFERRRVLERVLGYDGKKGLGFRLEACCFEFLRVALGLLGVDQAQRRSLAHFAIGVARP